MNTCIPGRVWCAYLSAFVCFFIITINCSFFFISSMSWLIITAAIIIILFATCLFGFGFVGCFLVSFLLCLGWFGGTFELVFGCFWLRPCILFLPLFGSISSLGFGCCCCHCGWLFASQSAASSFGFLSGASKHTNNSIKQPQCRHVCMQIDTDEHPNK